MNKLLTAALITLTLLSVSAQAEDKTPSFSPISCMKGINAPELKNDPEMVLNRATSCIYQAVKAKGIRADELDTSINWIEKRVEFLFSVIEKNAYQDKHGVDHFEAAKNTSFNKSADEFFDATCDWQIAALGDRVPCNQKG